MWYEDIRKSDGLSFRYLLSLMVVPAIKNSDWSIGLEFHGVRWRGSFHSILERKEFQFNFAFFELSSISDLWDLSGGCRRDFLVQGIFLSCEGFLVISFFPLKNSLINFCVGFNGLNYHPILYYMKEKPVWKKLNEFLWKIIWYFSAFWCDLWEHAAARMSHVTGHFVFST